MYPDVAKFPMTCWFLDWVIFYKNRCIFIFRFIKPSQTDVEMCVVFFSCLKSFCDLLYFPVFPPRPLLWSDILKDVLLQFCSMCFNQTKTFLENSAVS